MERTGSSLLTLPETMAGTDMDVAQQIREAVGLDNTLRGFGEEDPDISQTNEAIDTLTTSWQKNSVEKDVVIAALITVLRHAETSKPLDKFPGVVDDLLRKRVQDGANVPPHDPTIYGLGGIRGCLSLSPIDASPFNKDLDEASRQEFHRFAARYKNPLSL